MNNVTVTPTPTGDLPALIRSATVKACFGGISDMTLWRWIQFRGFPQPTKIAGRNYWNPKEVDAWRNAAAD